MPGCTGQKRDRFVSRNRSFFATLGGQELRHYKFYVSGEQVRGSE